MSDVKLFQRIPLSLVLFYIVWLMIAGFVLFWFVDQSVEIIVGETTVLEIRETLLGLAGAVVILSEVIVGFFADFRQGGREE